MTKSEATAILLLVNPIVGKTNELVHTVNSLTPEQIVTAHRNLMDVIRICQVALSDDRS